MFDFSFYLFIYLLGGVTTTLEPSWSYWIVMDNKLKIQLVKHRLQQKTFMIFLSLLNRRVVLEKDGEDKLNRSCDK